MTQPRRAQLLPALPALAMRLAYVLVIVLATASEPAAPAAAAWHERLVRAFAFHLSGTTIVDAARNILLFVGWGAVWTLTSPPGKAKPIMLRATLTGALLSGIVEAGQLFSATRYANIIDVITNTTGALLGAFGAVALVLALRAGHGRRSYLGIPALLLTASYAAAAFLQACFPLFRQKRVPGAWGPPGERLATALRVFPWTPVEPAPWSDLLLFVPAGLLAYAALAELDVGRRRALLIICGGAVTGFAAAELIRGLSGYPLNWRAFVTHLGGVAVGAFAAARWLPTFSRAMRGRSRVLAVLVGYAVVYGLWVLRPYALDFDGQRIAANLFSTHLVPLVSYRERVDLFTTADVAIPAFLMLPVGGLLAIWPLRRHGWLVGVLPVWYLAAALEAGQLFVAGRTFDVTDVVVAGAAATLGLALVRRAGYRTYGAVLPDRHTPT